MFSRLWNKILMLRKAFLTDFLAFHYSQFGEDIVLRELLKKGDFKGFFVDVGCYHPKKFSNTFMLYRRGWRGINVDAEEHKIALFSLARPQDHNVVCAVSDNVEETVLYSSRKYGLESTISSDHAAKQGDKPLKRKTVQTNTLGRIIDDSPYKGRQIDVLSIDVEGMDFRVLQSLDLRLYRPKIIIIEVHQRNIEDVLETNIYKLLEEYSYVLRSWTFYSLIFVLPGADILRERGDR